MFLLLMIGLNIYSENTRIIENLKVKKIGKSIEKGVKKTVKETGKAAQQTVKQTQQAANEAKKQAEKAAEEAKKIAENINIENALKNLISPVADLNKIITDTLNFLKQF